MDCGDDRLLALLKCILRRTSWRPDAAQFSDVSACNESLSGANQYDRRNSGIRLSDR